MRLLLEQHPALISAILATAFEDARQAAPFSAMNSTPARLWARIAARTIEVFHRGKRVAAHVRSSSNRKHTTVREHMPSSHRRYADLTPERLRRQAGEIGRNTPALVEIIMRRGEAGCFRNGGERD